MKSRTHSRCPYWCFIGCLALAAGIAAAQDWPCESGWAGHALPGVSNYLDADAVQDLKWWDPDGSGPQRPVVLIAGSFQTAGTVAGSSLVGYDPPSRTWRLVTDPIVGTVAAVCPLPDGRLAAAGNFTGPGLPATVYFAIWDGNRWNDDSTNIGSFAYSIAVLPSGEFVVGANNGILRRTAAGWVRMQSSSELSGVARILKTDSQGRLFAGGSLLVAGSYGVGMWDGTDWTNVYSTDRSDIGIIEELPDHCMLFARRIPWFQATEPGIAKWCNGELTDLTTVLGPYGFSGGYGTGALVMEDGRVIVQAYVWISSGVGYPLRLELRRNGWSLDTRSGTYARHMIQVGDDSFLYNNVARLGVREESGSLRLPLGDGLDNNVLFLLPLSEGRVLMSGAFVSAGVTALGYVAILDGGEFLPMQGGLDSPPRTVLRLDDGSWLVGGVFRQFSQDGGRVLSPCVARWDGQRWHPMGTQSTARVRKLFRSAAGDILAFGDAPSGNGTVLLKWDGQAWISLPVPAALTSGADPIQLSDGSLLAGRSSPTSYYRWDGTTWTTVTSPPSALGPSAMLELPGGDVLLCGGNGTLSRVNLASQQWTIYPRLLQGAVLALELLPRPDGGFDVLVGGEFTGRAPGLSPNIARWVPETNEFFPIGTGSNAAVRAIRRLPNGEILVGGDFTVFDGKVAAYLVRHRTACLSDFTCDGLVDGDDVIGFFDAWDQQLPTADADADGGLTEADIVVFFDAWDNGC